MPGGSERLIAKYKYITTYMVRILLIKDIHIGCPYIIQHRLDYAIFIDSRVPSNYPLFHIQKQTQPNTINYYQNS